jgi:sigma-B regulation protein RsbU (phosphoserine phosphatase)
MLAATQFVQQLADTIARLCFQSHELARRVEEMAVVRELSAMLARQSKLQDILDAATAQLVSSMNLRAAAIRLLDEDTGVLKMASVANLSREYLDKGQILAMDSPIDLAALGGETVYIEDLRTDPRVHHHAKARAEGLVSALVTPLAHAGKPIGVLRTYMSRVHQFTPPEASLIEAIASQVAAAIANARLHRDAEQAVRLDRQIKTAGEVQRRMIPETPPEHAHYEFGSVYDPTYDVGGDFFDFIRFDNGDIGVAIADVVGKGVPASLMMASARSALRSHARRVTDISDIIRSVNRRLCHDTLPGEFATAFYLELAADGRLLKFCNAGHEPLLLLRGGRIEELDVGGLALGIVEDATYESAETALMPGDVLVLATDGVLEALNYEGEAFGRVRLHNSVRLHGAMARDMPVQLIASQIQWDVRRFTGLAPVTDDLTLVVVRVL